MKAIEILNNLLKHQVEIGDVKTSSLVESKLQEVRKVLEELNKMVDKYAYSVLINSYRTTVFTSIFNMGIPIEIKKFFMNVIITMFRESLRKRKKR